MHTYFLIQGKIVVIYTLQCIQHMGYILIQGKIPQYRGRYLNILPLLKQTYEHSFLSNFMYIFWLLLFVISDNIYKYIIYFIVFVCQIYMRIYLCFINLFYILLYIYMHKYILFSTLRFILLECEGEVMIYNIQPIFSSVSVHHSSKNRGPKPRELPRISRSEKPR